MALYHSSTNHLSVNHGEHTQNEGMDFLCIDRIFVDIFKHAQRESISDKVLRRCQSSRCSSLSQHYRPNQPNFSASPNSLRPIHSISISISVAIAYLLSELIPILQSNRPYERSQRVILLLVFVSPCQFLFSPLLSFRANTKDSGPLDASDCDVGTSVFLCL